MYVLTWKYFQHKSLARKTDSNCCGMIHSRLVTQKGRLDQESLWFMHTVFNFTVMPYSRMVNSESGSGGGGKIPCQGRLQGVSYI